MELKNVEDRNFGWSVQRFIELKTLIQQSDATAFHADLEPHLKQCALYTMNLAKKWLKKDRLDLNEKHLVQDALHDAFARFEQRMFLETVEYGNLKDWLVGNAFSRVRLSVRGSSRNARINSAGGCPPVRYINWVSWSASMPRRLRCSLATICSSWVWARSSD